jgi:hypothetical protein
MNWKGRGNKWSWPNFKVLFQRLPGGTEESQENLSQDRRYPGRDLNPRPPEYDLISFEYLRFSTEFNVISFNNTVQLFVQTLTKFLVLHIKKSSSDLKQSR